MTPIIKNQEKYNKHHQLNNGDFATNHPSDSNKFNGLEVENDFAKFSKRSGIIIANRLEDELKKVSDKVYTRDLFARD